MADSLVIAARFNGPPDSGHGGYSAGLAAALVEGPAEVALRAPPPLERELLAERAPDGSVTVSRDGAVVMEARSATVELEVPDPVGVDEASAATRASRFLAPDHPFPTCFACGPEREEGDGLRLFAGAVDGRGLFAVPWTPASEFASGGLVDPLFVWAALDCPSSAPAMGGKPIVLASLAVDVREPVAVGEPHAIGSWAIASDGRKRHTGVALWDSAGSLRAIGRALWIELRDSP
jgi:hypothetical protein